MSDARLGERRIALVDARAVASGFVPLRRATDRPVTAPSVAVPEPDQYTLGYADGARCAADDFASERASLRGLVAAADALQPEPCEELAAMIAATVERLVTDLVGRAAVDHDFLLARVGIAMASIADADAARTLWLNPDDLALFGDAALPLAAHPDPTLERGALRIDCSLGWVEDGRSIHLDALRSSLGSVAT